MSSTHTNPAPRRSSRSRAPARLALVATAVGLASCASYPERTEEAFHAFQGGHFERAEKLYADSDTTGDRFLQGAEAGTAALVAGDWAGAQKAFHAAAGAVRSIEDRALVSASSLGESLASWAINDTSLPYRGEGFERVYVHVCLGMTYLAQGALDDVFVEVRRANKLLEAEEELYEKEYRAGGLGHFLSAVTYELLGEFDNAYIDYRRMVEKGVGTQIAGRALVRIANENNWADDAERWESEFGPDLDRPEGAASIVVLGGIGTGPYKREGSLMIATPDGMIPMAAPTYETRRNAVEGLRLVLGSGESVRTDVLEDVVDVAEENMNDRLLWIGAKSVARGLLKREFTKKLEDEWDMTGRILGDVFALATERADLRAWQTLPASWHAARMFVPPGAHELALEAIGGDRIALGAFGLEPGETLVIFARSLETRLYAHVIGGEPVAVMDP